MKNKQYKRICVKCKCIVIVNNKNATKVKCLKCKNPLEFLDKSKEGIEFVTCPLCNKRIKRLDGGHIQNVHKLIKSEFVKLFPDVKLFCDSWKNNVLKNHNLMHQDKYPYIQERATKSKRTLKYRKNRKKLSKEIVNRPGMKEKISKNTSIGMLKRTEEEVSKWKKKFQNTINQPNSKFMSHVDKMNEENKYKIKKYKCGWFVTKDQRRFWYRSDLELKFMKWLDNTQLKWDYERERIYIKSLGRRHDPDFYIYNWCIYFNLKPFIKYEKGRYSCLKEIEFTKQLKEENKKAFIIFGKYINEIMKLNPSNEYECSKIIEIGQLATERVIAGSTTIRKE